MTEAVTRRAALRSVVASLALPRLAVSQSNGSKAVVRRTFVDGPWGQVHARVAKPPGELNHPSLLLLHQTPLSSRMFSSVMPFLAHKRVVFAIDLPGYGESDTPHERPTIAGYGTALLDAARALGTTSVFDVLGYHTGTVLATQMAIQEPKRVRRLVLASVPVFTKEERSNYLKSNKPEPLADDGTHILKPWKSGVAARGPGQTLEMIQRNYAEKLRSDPDKTLWALESLFEYEIEAALRQLKQHVLLLRSGDTLKDHASRAQALLSSPKLLERLDLSYGLFDVDPAGLAREILQFLDSPQDIEIRTPQR